MRLTISQQRHDAVVSGRAGELSKEGKRVWADVEGYQQPQVIFGYRPDIIATNGALNLISEIETSETYASTHTRDQLNAFDSANNYFLEVVVPESVLEAAKAFCKGWGISVDYWRMFQG